MSYGNVPVGNDITFEGIQADCAALIFNDAQLRNFVQEPQLCKKRLLSEGALAIDQVRVSHSVERVGSAWVNVVWQ
jgi:hypothetical protein